MLARRACAFCLVTLGTAALAAGCGGGAMTPSAATAPSTATTAASAPTTKTKTTTATAPAAVRPSGATHAYELRMQRLGVKLGGSIQAIGDLMVVNHSVASKPQVVRDLRRLQIVLRSAASELTRIRPPAKVRDQHELLARGVREYAQELTGVIARVQSGDTAKALSLIPRLKGIRDMTTASHAIKKAGLNIGV
jgi:hypothetical protein